MTLLHVVDAFADAAFEGNPAAVALLERFPADGWMQKVAAEMNLSETAFVVGRTDGDFDLRWFTPSTEVDLCGHATLASAHVVGPTARFHTRSGVLACAPDGNGLIEMTLPADPLDMLEPPAALAGPAVVACGRGRSDLLVELDRADRVRGYRPDLAAIAALDCRAVIVTARADTAGFDCVSRVFAPAVGVPEDPVTGSAHCTLAGYWAPRLGRDRLVGRQVSARGGTVAMRLSGERVVLAGRAVTVSEVQLLVEPPNRL